MEHFLKNILFSIDKFSGGKHTVFAKKAGIPPSTFQSYMKGNLPKPEHLIRISETYKISIDWLLTGEGEMTIIKNSTPIYKVEKPEVDPETSELLNNALAVLKSETNYAQTLTSSIRGAYNAVKTEKRLNGLEKRLEKIEKDKGCRPGKCGVPESSLQDLAGDVESNTGT